MGCILYFNDIKSLKMRDNVFPVNALRWLMWYFIVSKSLSESNSDIYLFPSIYKLLKYVKDITRQKSLMFLKISFCIIKYCTF